MRPSSLFVGVTSWNSSRFLAHCLDSVVKSCAAHDLSLWVWDNESTDDSVAVARAAGARVKSRACSQADAMNGLLSLAREEYVLLLHSDVVLLRDDWFELCRERLSKSGSSLLAPEDVGCGPYTRPFGLGMPESSFLFMRRAEIDALRTVSWRRWKRLPYPVRRLDLYGAHVTHNLPGRLARAGLRWTHLDAQPSDRLPSPRYGPYPGEWVWSAELAFLRYGLGNFYSLDGVVTHYHNWYERVPLHAGGELSRSAARSFPPAFIREYTLAFLADYESGNLVVPPASGRDREPVAL